LVAPQHLKALRAAIPCWLEDAENGLTTYFRSLLHGLQDDLIALDDRVLVLGRQMAAAIGLTPRQHSSGGKDRLLGISKRGDAYLRALLVHGARSVVTHAKHKDDRLSRWATSIAQRHHPNVAAVALANKTARMAWAMLRNETDYDPDFTIS